MNLITLISTLEMANNNPNLHGELEQFDTKRTSQIFHADLDDKTQDRVLNIELNLAPENNNHDQSMFHFLMVSYDTRCKENPFVCIHQCKVQHRLSNQILLRRLSLHWTL